MIRFFRSIRQGLVNKGQTSKYFRYAVGGIILVVVGILIALQVNNWNIERAEAKLAQKYIERLIESVESDIGRFEGNIEQAKLKLGFVDFVAAAAEDPEIVRDRTAEFLFAVFYAPGGARAPLSSATYEEMVSNGFLRLLNDELKESVYNYYRRDRQIRDFNDFEADKFQYRELSAGVITYAQSSWMKDHFAEVFPSSMSTIQALTYDEDSVVEAARRLQDNKALIDWLPRIQRNTAKGLVTLNGSKELAEEVLASLKAAPEESN